MKKRAYSLDALRGYAILTMVLSATVASSVLPGWMYHAQEPPPTHFFNENIAGITWVDLVFPFFLFAMGAAFPFSVGKKLAAGEPKWRLSYNALIRGIELTFFAIFIQHFYPYVLSNPQDPRAWGLALLCFILLFPMFMRIPLKMPKWAHLAVKLSAYVIAFILLLNIRYADGREFNPEYSNIIILLLANMATFGTLAYIFTAQNRLARLAILPFLMALFLGHNADGSWVQLLYNYSPLPWMYRFEYLRYLFIVIPGSIAGEYLLEWMNQPEESPAEMKRDKGLAFKIILLSVVIIVTNLCCLYARRVNINFIINLVYVFAGIRWLRNQKSTFGRLWKKMFFAGSFLLILGLFFEPFQGGIRKDFPTYSYYFVTSGLAFMALLIFSILCDYFKLKRCTSFLVLSGQNPMIAYVACDLVIMPLLNLTGTKFLLDYLTRNAFPGFIHGVILTGITIIITMFFSRKKWYWRT